MKRQVFYYLCGTVIAFVLLSAMPMMQPETNRVLLNYVILTAGLVLGCSSKKLFVKRPWLLFFVPILPLVLGCFG